MLVIGAAVVALGVVAFALWRKRQEETIPIPPLQLGTGEAREALLQARQQIQENLAARVDNCKHLGRVREKRCKRKAVNRANRILGRLDKVIKRAAGRQFGGGLGNFLKSVGESGLLQDIQSFTGTTAPEE